ncbi:UDP-glucuronosyltransferase 1-6-like [Gracilinanus agilis]|uniref:UDP-glucuronosyltransferase 1-6-like n=1 Tax=Gracilinanus agilis TaxID=191870 RepID=UPI001CFD8F2E|nr:UDP-glucuronosyltransferase 1-6-like [Gracilinanus agilis]
MCRWQPLLLKFFLPFLALATGDKLLVVPMDGSHWLSMLPVVKLLSQRGHEVVVLMPHVSQQMKNQDSFTAKLYQVPYTKEQLKEAINEFFLAHLQKLPPPLFFVKILQSSESFKRILETSCESLLKETKLIQDLQESHFDALLTNPLSTCGTILAEYLSLPSIYLTRGLPCNMDYSSAKCPSPPSYIPRLFARLTDHMTFPQRLANVLIASTEHLYCYYLHSSFNRIASEFLQRDVRVKDLLKQDAIWLLRYDFVVEFPRPVMPNMVFVGGLNCHPSSPLTEALLQKRHCAASEKLLVLPIDGSHWLSMRDVTEELSKKGHEIVVLVPEVNLLLKESKFYKRKLYPVSYSQEELEKRFQTFGHHLFAERSFLGTAWAEYCNNRHIIDLYFFNCDSLLKDHETIRYLEESKFDALFTDPALPCGVILAEYLAIPSMLHCLLPPNDLLPESDKLPGG